MTFNPYQELDVPKDTTVMAARKAYRRKAKKAHPDGGGTAADFQRLNRAMAVIADTARRERFDRTGEDQETNTNIILSQAISIIMQVITNTVAEWAAGNDACPDIETRPLIADLVQLLTTALYKIATVKQEQDRYIDKLRCTADRLTKKSGGNSILINSLREEANRIEATVLVKLEADRAAHTMAMEIVSDHSFSPKKVDRIITPSTTWRTTLFQFT